MNTSVKQEMCNEASILDNTVITVNWELKQKHKYESGKEGLPW